MTPSKNKHVWMIDEWNTQGFATLQPFWLSLRVALGRSHLSHRSIVIGLACGGNGTRQVRINEKEFSQSECLRQARLDKTLETDSKKSEFLQ